MALNELLRAEWFGYLVLGFLVISIVRHIFDLTGSFLEIWMVIKEG